MPGMTEYSAVDRDFILDRVMGLCDLTDPEREAYRVETWGALRLLEKGGAKFYVKPGDAKSFYVSVPDEV